jgi:prevent-host-death family protein
MEQIGIRELRQHASKWLRKVQEGQSFEITDRGRPVALLVPAPPDDDVIARLAAQGRLTLPKGSIFDLGPPLPAEPGKPTLSEVLEKMRADERW